MHWATVLSNQIKWRTSLVTMPWEGIVPDSSHRLTMLKQRTWMCHSLRITRVGRLRWTNALKMAVFQVRASKSQSSHTALSRSWSRRKVLQGPQAMAFTTSQCMKDCTMPLLPSSSRWTEYSLCNNMVQSQILKEDLPKTSTTLLNKSV